MHELNLRVCTAYDTVRFVQQLSEGMGMRMGQDAGTVGAAGVAIQLAVQYLEPAGHPAALRYPRRNPEKSSPWKGWALHRRSFELAALTHLNLFRGCLGSDCNSLTDHVKRRTTLSVLAVC